MICIVRPYCGEQWQRQGAGLGIRRAQGRWARQQARVLGRWGVQRALGRAAERWGVQQSAGRAGVARTDALEARGRARARARSRARARVRARGQQAHGQQAHGRQAAARGACAAEAAGARPGCWARGLGAWAGLGQCTRCTRPIFDPF